MGLANPLLNTLVLAPIPGRAEPFLLHCRLSIRSAGSGGRCRSTGCPWGGQGLCDGCLRHFNPGDIVQKRMLGYDRDSTGDKFVDVADIRAFFLVAKR
ncbi:MAG: hypothetical protein ACK559_13080, partial [bacterium]